MIAMAARLANTPAKRSKQAAQATPKGSLRLLCAFAVRDFGRFSGRDLGISSAVRESRCFSGRDYKKWKAVRESQGISGRLVIFIQDRISEGAY